MLLWQLNLQQTPDIRVSWVAFEPGVAPIDVRVSWLAFEALVIASGLKVWTGSQWKPAALKTWDGSQWITSHIKRREASAWV